MSLACRQKLTIYGFNSLRSAIIFQCRECYCCLLFCYNRATHSTSVTDNKCTTFYYFRSTTLRLLTCDHFLYWRIITTVQQMMNQQIAKQFRILGIPAWGCIVLQQQEAIYLWMVFKAAEIIKLNKYTLNVVALGDNFIVCILRQQCFLN